MGSRPGEKFYEELISEEEVRRTRVLDRFYCVLPAHRNIYGNIDFRYDCDMNELADDVYKSSGVEPLSKAEIRTFLKRPDVLPAFVRKRVLQTEAKASATKAA